MLRKVSPLLRSVVTFLVLNSALPVAALAQTPTVLAELFRNIDCGNCQVADNSFEAYVKSHPGVVLINYNNSTPNPNDPFYLASSPASHDRDLF